MTRPLRWGWAWLGVAVVACSPGVDEPAAGNRIILTRFERLIAPAVPQPGAYQPRVLFDIDPLNPNGGRAAGFFLWVRATRIDDVTLRWRDRTTERWIDLVAVAPVNTPQLFDPAVDAWRAAHGLAPWLASDQGVFWIDATGTAGERRIGVAVPETWMEQPGLLELAAGRLPDGTGVGTQHIELARGFFYMTAIGDSAMWGNGLRERQKFTTLVAQRIERTTGRKVVREILAISGSRIVTTAEDGICIGACEGEVPRAIRSVTAQLDFIERPDLVDLLLVDGCANDVGLDLLLSTETTLQDITERTREFCEVRMADLLRDARARAPHAAIIVTGYFPILSAQSDVSELQQWVQTLDVPILDADDLGSALSELTPNTMAFWEVSTASLQAAVDAVTAADPGAPPVRFADPGFGPQNATFGPQSWLWGLTSSVDVALFQNLNVQLQLFPEDGLLDERVAACAEPGVYHDYIPCVYSSVAHPNPAGARAFADAIMAVLAQLDIAVE